MTKMVVSSHEEDIFICFPFMLWTYE